jgi:hypothetical protein
MAVLLLAAAWAQESPRLRVGEKASGDRHRYLRLVRDKRRVPTALETAVVHLVPQDCGRNGPTVDLVAVVHVADKTYYQQLNRQLADYDAVLYEMVAPEGTRITKEGARAGGNPISSLQRLMSQVMELQYQLEGIDYTRKNMVHADMSPALLARSMKDRGESTWTMLLRMMGYAMARESGDPAGGSNAQLLLALFDKNRALAIKRVMAEQFEDVEHSMSALEGADGGSALISERNKVALAVLRRQIDSGKQKLAVFYGGAHMPDFEKRLHDDFALVPLGRRWLVAWNLAPGGKAKAEGEGEGNDQ